MTGPGRGIRLLILIMGGAYKISGGESGGGYKSVNLGSNLFWSVSFTDAITFLLAFLDDKLGAALSVFGAYNSILLILSSKGCASQGAETKILGVGLTLMFLFVSVMPLLLGISFNLGIGLLYSVYFGVVGLFFSEYVDAKCS